MSWPGLRVLLPPLCCPSDPSGRAGTTQPPSQTSPARPLRPEWEEKKKKKPLGKAARTEEGQQTPTEGHRGPHPHRGASTGEQRCGKLASQPPTLHPSSLFSQDGATLQTLPEGPRHFREAVTTRTERSSLPEPAGWSLFPLPFVSVLHSSQLLLGFLWALKKPQRHHPEGWQASPTCTLS